MQPPATTSESRSPLFRSLRKVTVAGCLAMVYITCTTCPARTDFFRALGASEIHFGFLSGIPMFMVALQFVGAVACNRLRRRKPLFMALFITGRLLFIPAILLPFAAPPESRGPLLVCTVAMLGVSAALMSFGSPLWFSWMADLVPGRILNRYWGTRQGRMSLCWAGTFLLIAGITLLAPVPITVLFPLLASVGIASGIMDIALFAGIHEPKNTTLPKRQVLSMLLEPLQHPEYRTFVLYSCAWSAVVMSSAVFMQLYVLKELGVPLWQVMLIWCIPGLGNALAAKHWGRIADRRGHRPVLAVCTAVKPMIALVFLLLTPGTVMWALPVAFLLDGALNAGNLVATNGYMMKIAPQENRSVFMASITGLAGICGGLGAIAGGAFLESCSSFSWHVMGRTWTRFHLLFLIGFVLRVGCAFLVHFVREVKSAKPRHVLHDIAGIWPLRFLRFPVGLYRRHWEDALEEETPRKG